MSSRKKILIFIDYEMILRHFIVNATFKELSNKFDIVYVFNNDRHDFKNDSLVKKYIDLKDLRITRVPRNRVGKWFFLYIITVLRQQIGTKNYRARVRQEYRRLGKRNVFFAKIVGLPLIYEVFRFFFIKKMGIHPDVLQIIKNEKPDIIMHPSILQGYYVNELLRFYISNKTIVPLIFLMNSWDNPSAKALCTGKPSKLVVWGKQSKKHAIEYMKINPEDIECFGAAQFEVYKTKTKLNRIQLCNLFNVEKNKKIILYAGSGHGSYETYYLKLLDKYIENNFLPNCQVIYRPHPWRGGLAEGEEDFLSLNFKNIVMDPTMIEYYKSQIRNPTGQMFLADYKVSRDLLTLVDAVISPLSTMLVESILNGKPILMFFPNEAEGKGWEIDSIHFAEFINMNIVNKCFNEDQFLESCKNLYKQIGDPELSAKLIKASEFFVEPTFKSYGRQLLELAERFLGK